MMENPLTASGSLPNLTKWRLILGGGEADGTGISLDGDLAGMDATLEALYGFDEKGKFEYGEPSLRGGREGSSPGVSRWLGDIRKYFPNPVVEVLQNDAIQKPVLRDIMIFEPEILEKAVADVNLVATLMQLGKLIPSKTKDTARKVIRKVVDELMQRLEQKTISSLLGSLDKAARNRRPKHNEINWHATILKNLKHYQPEFKTIIPETLVGYGRKTRKSLKDIILCIDQSGSMGTSIVYSSIFGAVMASLPTVKTRLVLFDTQVTDVTDELSDPVDLLFGVQMGGGTDIDHALGYCQEKIVRPEDTIFVLISDLIEGGNQEHMHKRAKDMVDSGVQFICLIALTDQGEPSYDKKNAQAFSEIGIPVFGCTPDLFPELMANAIRKLDIKRWLGEKGMVAR